MSNRKKNKNAPCRPHDPLPLKIMYSNLYRFFKKVVKMILNGKGSPNNLWTTQVQSCFHTKSIQYSCLFIVYSSLFIVYSSLFIV